MVLQPGGPGEEAQTVGPDAGAAEGDFSHDDVAFVQMMIPHHAQALVMSDLAPGRAESRQVKALARRISAAQRPEILTMAAWLQEKGFSVPTAADDPSAYDHGEHGHATMHGMLSDEQMRALEAASGAEFDRLFLEGMIQHHQGAIEMADAVARRGSDVRVTEMAEEMVIGQGAEVDRMRAVLERL
ncbi:uncharacterized protein (DUF305 family) [Nocardioides sp. J9]|uniref:DUF305 domain-containing protein n=1 Tax=Nocardioides sp. J9 TaxID=935844 RepID=UPI0011ACCC08|nr:DUF305 domain-containing protein [Nocardioides sp. J9]TWG92619.1 uncharacterized protein (DUF305 family) [Nocardioides sp. J9]